MANEGSTKPTYSELEAEFNREFDERTKLIGQLNKATDEGAHLMEQLEVKAAELLRVRGLLQRQADVLQRIASWDFDFYGDCVAEAKKLASDALSHQNDSSSSSTIETRK